MARKTNTQALEPESFVPRQVDKHAIEVQPGKVKISGLPGLQSLDLYLQRQAELITYTRSREKALYLECREFISINLPLRDGQWQETLRKLSWAYTSQPNNSHLRTLVGMVPSMALALPTESTVQTHHLSHFIKAFLATIMQLSPVPVGHSSNLLVAGEYEEEALQARITTWEYLLSLIPSDRQLPVSKKLNPLQILQQQNNHILEMIELLTQSVLTLQKELLCQTKTKQAKLSKNQPLLLDTMT